MHQELNGVPPELHSYRLKVVSKSDTNEDGRWITVHCPKYSGTRTIAHFGRYVDAGDFLVQVTDAEDDLTASPSPSM
jgi:hypothetical protein